MTSSQFSSTEDTDSKKTLNFSIEHILNHAGNQENSEQGPENCLVPPGNLTCAPFPWLQCTRYCPPRIPRNQKKEVPQKRQLGRHPRIPFTSHQLAVLEEKFKQSTYLSSAEVKEVSKKLDLADIRVKIWFQNRRARERREKSFTRDLANDICEQTIPSHTTSSTSNTAFQIGDIQTQENGFPANNFNYQTRTHNLTDTYGLQENS